MVPFHSIVPELADDISGNKVLAHIKLCWLQSRQTQLDTENKGETHPVTRRKNTIAHSYRAAKLSCRFPNHLSEMRRLGIVRIILRWVIFFLER
jgi:hypothetical protein